LQATGRDPDAFAVVYRRYVHGVLALVASRAPPSDVGDIVAEVFASALVHRCRFDPERGPASAWLRGIAADKLADIRRRGAVQARICERLQIRRPSLNAADIELEDPDSLLAELPEMQRRAVRARVLLDRPYEQIAGDERVSEQVVRNRVSRALSTLRDRLQEDEK
jgi:RNA polymerase sigma-70 factor (ECF subfamily)